MRGAVWCPVGHAFAHPSVSHDSAHQLAPCAQAWLLPPPRLGCSTLVILCGVLLLTLHSAWFVLPVYALCMLASDEAVTAAAQFIQDQDQ